MYKFNNQFKEAFSCFTLRKNMKCKILTILLGILLFSGYLNAQVEQTIKVGTITRQMIVYAPTGIEKNRPLVISMHGMNQTMTDQKNQTQFVSVAKANNFVLVFPQSNGSQWELWGTNDINFILAIIDEMYKSYGIDRDRVYLSGFSMGGMMTYYAATQIADKIAAFAPVSGFLMSGPNTNSSRPIPLIHIHGADDTYVPYSSVQTHIDAWVKRNGCITPAVVTKPYPANVPTSLSVKKYYGPGKDGVEVVFIGVAGVGHWYSDNNWSADGIFSSLEIWNFCKKYSLKDGIPEFKYASVTNKNPKQIQVEMNKSIIDSGYFKGFTVKIDDKIVQLDSVVLVDTISLAVCLKDSVMKTNKVSLSYADGNVMSVFNKKLANFNDTLVDNLLKGASPRITGIVTNKQGDTLKLKFNMKMNLPGDSSGLALSSNYGGGTDIPIHKPLFINNDSSSLVFPLGQKVYRDYELFLTYSGSNIVSLDSGLLEAVTNFQVLNCSDGLPVHLDSGIVESDGITMLLKFSKPMAALDNGQSGYFKITKNGVSMQVKNYSVVENAIQFTLQKGVHFGDTVKVSYSPGNIKSFDNGLLEGFNSFVLTNQLNIPTWMQIPGKIEAENYTLKSGMQTETTGDVGGGLNLGYISTGDWLEYAIKNDSTESNYIISFRVAAQGTGAIIDYYIDDIHAGSVNVPSTGNWQVYTSVEKNISIGPGKHYLKVVATVSGFNINYMNIYKKASGIKDVTEADLSIYPNPLSNEMIIKQVNFQYDKVEVFDARGNLVVRKTTAGETVLHVPINLTDGVYMVKISNATHFLMKKVIVANK